MTERVRTDPRISRRRRAVERSRRRRLMFRFIALAAIAAVVWLAFASPVVAVRDLRVVGSRRVTPADVERAAGVKGDNLLLLDSVELARAVETLPWVRRAEIDRILPGTVRVRVQERRPALVLTVADGAGVERWTLDERGRVLARGVSGRRLPVVAGIDPGPLEPGAVMEGREATAALTAYRRMPRSLKRRVVAVFAPTLERITFSLDDRTMIRYGAAERLRAKNAVLRALLARLKAQGRQVGYIDVRVPSSPALSTVVPADAAPLATGA